jgi:hypothetical protein
MRLKCNKCGGKVAESRRSTRVGIIWYKCFGCGAAKSVKHINDDEYTIDMDKDKEAE